MKLLATTTLQTAQAVERLIEQGLDFKVTNCTGTEFGRWIEFDPAAHLCNKQETAYLIGDLTKEPEA